MYKRRILFSRIIVYLIIIFMILILILLTNKTKYNIYAMATDSMKPHINKGDIVICRRVEYQKLKIGDVVAILYNNETIINRIINIDNDIYSLKGDNRNNIIRVKDIIGKVIIRIPYLGSGSVWLSEQP